MKRFVFLLSLILLLGNINYADAAVSNKSEVKAIKNILKNQIQAANKYSYPDFIKYFDFSYINSDGFGLDIYSKLVEDTWASYSNIQYAQKVKNITVNGKDAMAEVVETANAKIESQYNLTGNLKSIANNIYFLKKTTNGWRIVSDVILTEDTYLSFGELSNYTPVLNVPYQIGANRSYTATLEYTAPKNTIAIASINQEKVSYPQQASKENYRKLPDDGILERFFTANGDGVNEYIVASLGLTRPEFDNKDLQINVTGIAYVIKRVNVVPENKFIDKTDVVPVNVRLQQLKEAETQAELDKTVEPEKREIKQKETEKQSEVVSPENKSEAEQPEKVETENKPAEETSKTDESEVNINNTKVEENNAQPADLKSAKTEVPADENKTEDVKQDEKPVVNNKVENTDKVDNAAPADKDVKASEQDKADIKVNDNIGVIAEPGQKVDNTKSKKTKVKKHKADKVKADKVKKKSKKDKSLKGTYSPDTVGIPTTATVCPVKEPQTSAN